MSDRYLPDAWVVPLIDERNEAFFTSGALRLTRCRSCGHVQHPPGEVCTRCQAFDFGHVDAAPHGSIASFTLVHHAVNDQLAEAVPYNVVVVELDQFPHVRIVGNVIDATPAELCIGRTVTCDWVDVAVNQGDIETVRLPQWRLDPPTIRRDSDEEVRRA
ncbi:MAG: OB-fold domain-containing protein [Acidimicrobiales bacterium]